MTNKSTPNEKLNLINIKNNKSQTINKKTPHQMLDIISKQGLLNNTYSGGNFNPAIKGAGLIQRKSGAFDVITPEGGRYLFLGFAQFLKAIKHSEKDLNLTLFQ